MTLGMRHNFVAEKEDYKATSVKQFKALFATIVQFSSYLFFLSKGFDKSGNSEDTKIVSMWS